MRQESLALTTPAPPSFSKRPTSVPDFSLAELAEVGFRRDAVALDAAIPHRVKDAWAEGVDLRAACVLLHANGKSTVRDIAEQLSLEVSQVIDNVLALVAAGLVTLGSDVRSSGIFTR